MVDTHCHLGLCEEDAGEIVERARSVGVNRILTVGLDEASNADAVALAASHDPVWACVGRHPNSAGGFDDRAAAAIEQLAADPRVAAIGETGLDYYRDGASRVDQRRAFEAQIGIARRAEKPLVVHMRDSLEDTFDLLRDRAGGVDVILHCFSGDAAAAEDAAAQGWRVSFAGNVTYPKSDGLREAAQAVPDELLLVETDAPFLAPQPVRGRPNEPANVVHTARVVAEARGIDHEALGTLVEANAARAFGW